MKYVSYTYEVRILLPWEKGHDLVLFCGFISFLVAADLTLMLERRFFSTEVSDRLHHSTALRRTIPRILIDVFAPETVRTVVRVAVSFDLSLALLARKILNGFLKSLFRKPEHSDLRSNEREVSIDEQRKRSYEKYNRRQWSR